MNCFLNYTIKGFEDGRERGKFLDEYGVKYGAGKWIGRYVYSNY
jgi:hypothetical protein